jgi:lysozyme
LRARRPRWPFVTGAIVIVVAFVAAAAWFAWLPRHRPHLHRGERFGIDVSAHQGRINWRKVRGDGISLAYIKATEGGDFVDRLFAANWAGTHAAGVDRSAYHFFTPCTLGAVQAEHFLRTAPPKPDALAPAVDLDVMR